MAGPGQQPLTPPQQGTLASVLGANSPPRNTKIPIERIDPEHTWLERLKGVQHALHELDELLDDKDDITGSIIAGIGQAVNRLMQGVPPNEITLLVGASLLKPVAPQLAAMAESQWVDVNRAPIASGAVAGPQGPTPPGGGGPGAVSPGQNPGVLAAMIGGGAPGGMAGSQPPFAG